MVKCDGDLVDVFWQPSHYAFAVRRHGTIIDRVPTIALVGVHCVVDDTADPDDEDHPVAYLRGHVAPNVIGLVGTRIRYDPETDPDGFIDDDDAPVGTLAWVAATLRVSGRPLYVGSPT
jgi:hypothetical protein